MKKRPNDSTPTSIPNDLDLAETALPEPPQPRCFSPMRWLVGTALLSFVLGVGTLTVLFRTLQTYRYYDWTIIPASDTRLEAACGELKLYYMAWQDPKAEKPVAHHIDVADNQRCLDSAKAPTPADRFSGLKDPSVLAKLECQPDIATPDAVAFAWNCKQPVGKLLKAEIDSANQATSSTSANP